MKSLERRKTGRGTATKPLTVVVLLLLACSSAALAQPTGDLELQVLQGPPYVTPAASTGILTFRIVNHGPDAVGFTQLGANDGVLLTARKVPFHDDYGMAAFFRPADFTELVSWDWGVPSPSPGDAPTASFVYTHLVLQPGESWTQSIEYEITYYTSEIVPSGHFDVLWRVSLASDDIDPNPDNNATTLRFNLVLPPRVPTVSPAGLVALALGLLLAFAWVRHRSQVS